MLVLNCTENKVLSPEGTRAVLRKAFVSSRSLSETLAHVSRRSARCDLSPLQRYYSESYPGVGEKR